MSTNRTVVLKFGGASLSTPEQFDIISDLIVRRSKEYPHIVIVVSAMGKSTDELLALATKVNPTPPQREVDMLLSAGERISMSLLAMACAKKGLPAVSFTGSQSGIITCPRHSEAKIIDVRPFRLKKCLEENNIVIVAGFQGVSRSGEITTLGRGGSDTTAVALGVALGAEKVEFYKDVPGFCSEDPKKNPDACLFSSLSYTQASEIVAKGAKILHHRSLLLAMRNQIPLHILSFKSEYQQFGGTVIYPENRRPETVCYEEELQEIHACSTISS
jgi:aspartate kinase